MRRLFKQLSISAQRSMANLPPRKISPSSKPSKQDTSPLQILLQMGFPKHRALKALAATGNRSVQLASDWLLTHVNDALIDADEPREYILYANPTGAMLTQLHEFWEKSKKLGWNGAHHFPPHITLVSFFKAPDETSLQLGKIVKNVVETVGDPPACPIKLDPYISQNFMGLFVSEEHAEYLKKIAVQYVKQVSALLGVSMDTYEHLDALGTCFPWCTMPQEKPIKSINLEAQVKSLHITLAYHFEVAAFDALKALVGELQPLETANWELRLYSRDPKFANHQVHKVTQGYSPIASDELELVLGDYIYIEEKAFDSSPDGWVHGTSWLTGLQKLPNYNLLIKASLLTSKMARFVKCFRLFSLKGVSGYLPAVYTRRTAESDAWTLHRAISLGNNNSSDCKSESDSNTDGEMTSYPHEDATKLGHEKSEEVYKEWERYWEAVMVEQRSDGMLHITQGTSIDWRADLPKPGDAKAMPVTVKSAEATTHQSDETTTKDSETAALGSEEATLAQGNRDAADLTATTRGGSGEESVSTDGDGTSEATINKPDRRWIFALRHGERVDLTYGAWVPFCCDEQGKYVRKDLNMPLQLGERAGGMESYSKDTPLTRVGRLQAALVGEGLRLARVRVAHVVASAALRCVETAHHVIEGLQDPSLKVKVDPGLFEFKAWYASKGMAPFMTPQELHKAGYNVDLEYKPYVSLDTNTSETMEEFYKRTEFVMQSTVQDTEAEGGNIIFVGHAATLDMMVHALNRLADPRSPQPPYQLSKHLLRVPYCALAAMRDRPWQVLSPPCPPSINSSSGRFDWRLLLDL